MSFTQYRNNLRLVARNEGKIKSYESCTDVRAWSHDVTARDRYLREWMKADMPICVIPSSTLSGCLRTMTCKSRSRATPRCHPDCKSKVLLESICTSCVAMKQCIQQDPNLEKYFSEEELETSHWPCDRCLVALKSIKMFWKIIIDKLFHLNINKCESFVPNCEPTNSVRTIAKVWQTEILNQALFVKSITPALSKTSNLVRCGSSSMRERPRSSRKTLKLCRADNGDDRKYTPSSKVLIKSSESNLTNKKLCKKVSKCTCFRTKTVDFGCNTSLIDGSNNETYKKSIQVLQDKCNNQSVEIEKLRKKNNSLKKELEKIKKSCPWKASFYVPGCRDNDHRGVHLVPKPFEANLDSKCSTKNTDSEMIITMKNCKNENFRHVSLLQVLHKTNDPIVQNGNEGRTCRKKEDPIQILNKVQNTFGAIVRREISIVNERRYRPKRTDVDASFHQINSSKSGSSSTLSSGLSSDCEFISTKDFNDRNSGVTNI